MKNNHLTILIIAFFSVLISCSGDKKAAEPVEETKTEETQTKVDEKVQPKQLAANNKKVKGNYYVAIQEALNLSNAQTNALKKIIFDYTKQKQALNKEGKWKGQPNASNRRVWLRAQNKEILELLGQDLFDQRKAFDKEYKKKK